MGCSCYEAGDIPAFPPKFPGAILDWGLDISQAIDPGADFILSATVQVAPSGNGELSIDAFGVFGYVLSVTLSSGQPRRDYTLKFTVTMTDGRVFVFVATLCVIPVLPSDIPPLAPSNGFGPPVD
jgi:hypothetical protein